jgi:putative Mg2+ transporter-C (MgtC) family protein
LLLLASSAPTLDGWHAFLRLLLAAGLGGVVGFERQLHDRDAGIRTHLLVALGSAFFTIVSAYGFTEFAQVRWDPTRIAAQIVTGIGFLGAGAIIRDGLSVRGLTTAATLWVVAAIGMGAGAGYYWPTVAATAVVFIALWPLRIVNRLMFERIKPDDGRIEITLKKGQPLKPLLGELTGLRHFALAEERDRRVVTVELAHVDQGLVSHLGDLEYVIGLRWAGS